MPFILICLVAASLLFILGILISDWFEKRRKRAFFQSYREGKANQQAGSLQKIKLWNRHPVVFVVAFAVAIALYHRKTLVSAKPIRSVTVSSPVPKQAVTEAMQFEQNSTLTLAYPKRAIRLEKITYRLNQKLNLGLSIGEMYSKPAINGDIRGGGTSGLFELCSRSGTDLATLQQSDLAGPSPSSRSELSLDSFDPRQNGLMQK